MIARHIQSSFDRQSLMRTFGARLVAAANGRAVIEAPVIDGARQQHGYAHAGLTFAIGDSAAGYAALSLMDEANEVLTAEMKISLLRPTNGDLIIAHGAVAKPGRRLFVVTAEVYARRDGSEVQVALLQGTMIPA